MPHVLARYHCETVMGSMVGTSLDNVDTATRGDRVSLMVYHKYHGILATNLALFTEALALMLSGSNTTYIHVDAQLEQSQGNPSNQTA